MTQEATIVKTKGPVDENATITFGVLDALSVAGFGVKIHQVDTAMFGFSMLLLVENGTSEDGMQSVFPLTLSGDTFMESPTDLIGVVLESAMRIFGTGIQPTIEVVDEHGKLIESIDTVEYVNYRMTPIEDDYVSIDSDSPRTLH